MELRELAYVLSGDTKLCIEAKSRVDGAYTNVAVDVEMKDLGNCKYKDEEIVVMWPSGMNTMVVIVDKLVDCL